MATEEELASIRGLLFGLIDEERIRAVDIPRPESGLVEGFQSLGDLCSSISDAMDTLGVQGGISGTTLVPRVAGSRIVGPAITIRYAAEVATATALQARGERARLADRDLYNVGAAGDVAVFDCGGHVGASVMGGLSGAWARRLDIAGCIVDGAVRDIESIRAEGVPVWSRGLTPVSGKHRLAAVEINGPVSIGDISVSPGDIVAADETGVCVIPLAEAPKVLELCRQVEAAESSVLDAIRSGQSREEIASIFRPERW